MQIRKIMMGMGIITIISSPIIAIISCGKKKIIESKSNNKSSKDFKVNNFKPLDFNIFKQIGQHEPIFFAGINSTAYAQGMSLLFNIIKGMGWSWEDADKIKKLYNASFDFKSITIAKNPQNKFITSHQASSFEIYLQEAFHDDYDKGLSQFIEKRAHDPLVSKLYNQILFLDLLTDDNILEADASTKIEVQLDEGFTFVSSSEKKLQWIANKLNQQIIVDKIFQNKKYAYSWSGTVLNKLGFQIQGTKLLLWHMTKGFPNIVKKIASIRKMNHDLQLLIKTDELTSQDQKNLSQVVIDPLGANGTMPLKILNTNLNLKIVTMNTRFNNDSIVFNIMRLSKGNGKFDWTKGQYPQTAKLQHVTTFNSFIDAAHPGSVVLKMFESSELLEWTDTHKISHPLKTFNTRNRIQTFYEITNASKKDNMVDLIFSFINFIKKQVKNDTKEIKTLKKIVSPVVNSFFEFIKNNDITKNDVKMQFDKCNNGSHYMLAVEIFLRGMINIPDKLTSNYDVPTGVKLWIGLQPSSYKRKKNEIVGMSNTNNMIAMPYMMYPSNKVGYNTNIYSHFDPSTLDFAISIKPQPPTSHFIEDLRSQKRVGKETPVYQLE